MRKAWLAVEKAGIPPSLQEAAFKEAVDYLRGPAIDESAAEESKETKPPRSAAKRAAKPKTPASQSTEVAANEVDEDSFFANLATESGVEERDLRDILHLTKEGAVQVTTPTKDLGGSVSEQAKTVIALVASARSKGLSEKPVSADAVRREVDRKHCYQPNNFATGHLRPLKGFNSGTKDEIHLTSKWVDEFVAAVNKAHGRTATES